VVREFQAEAPSPHFYPGSPRLIQRQQRAQDRLFLCERHPEEAETLRNQFARSRRVTVQAGDGYQAVAATLPPPERRALVLIDPPYESVDEFRQIEVALAEGLRRLPGACFMVWYPLSRRAGSVDFLQSVAHARPAPALAVELKVAGAESGLPMWGSGLLILNPPYLAATEWAGWLPWRTFCAKEAGPVRR
jgi:23S rRNA (adenine2030-N6)-methyltransferase